MNQKRPLRKYYKQVRQLMCTNGWWFVAFVLNQSLFLAVLGLFVYDCIDQTAFISYLIVVLSAILVLTYVALNFAGVNTYFREINMYEYEVKVNKIEHPFRRHIFVTPLTFLIWSVICNLFLAVVLTHETDALITSKLLSAFVTVGLNVLLIPSFTTVFVEVTNRKKEIHSSYSILIKKQYYANEALFENIEIHQDWQKIDFTKINFSSKTGIFVLQDKETLSFEESAAIEDINNAILDKCKALWATYFELLKLCQIQKFGTITRHKLKNAERFFDTIFLDFFGI